MANEPKPPAHDRLTAYATERRRQLGTPPTLPPHTRSVLLAEVQRLYGGARAASASPWRAWLRHRPGWGWAVAFSSVAVVGSALWLALGPPRTARVEMAKRDPLAEGALPQSIPLAAPVPPMASQPASEPTTLTRVEPPPGPSSPSALRVASESATRARPVPPASVPPSNRPSAGAASDSTVERLAPAPTTSAAPARPTPAPGAQKDRAGPHFVNQMASTLDSRRSFTSSSHSPVLSRFQIESGGGQLRIIDADGSVYAGTFAVAAPSPTIAQRPVSDRPATQMGPATTRTAAPAAEPTRYGLARRSTQGTESNSVQPPVPRPSSSGELTFEAAGTNRSTGQQVRIEGRMVPTNQPILGLEFARLPEDSSAQAMQLFLQKAVIRGQAWIGEPQTTIPIEAVPAGP